MKGIILLFLTVVLSCLVSPGQCEKEAATLRFKTNMVRLGSALRDIPSLLSGHGSELIREKRAYGGSGSGGVGGESPLFVGIGLIVDAIGQIIRSFLQILGLLPEEQRPMHYCYGSSYSGL